MPALALRYALLPMLVVGLVLVLWTAVQTAPRAQELAPPVLAVIDVQKVRRDSTAVKALSKRIAEQKAQYQDQLREQERTLREADQELARQRSILSPEAYANKRGELEQRVGSMQREARNRKRGLDNVFAQGMARVQAELAAVAKEIAEERGLDLILSKAIVVLVKPKFELTQEAVRRLNARLPVLPATQPEN
ncbi:MAG: OmpH family outer membrane protein [Alphaproteobacteria bacterium]